MNILDALKQLRDDIKVWVTNNLNALNTKIDEKTIPIDSELSSTSTNPVQNQVIAKEIDSINDRVGDISVATQISQAINAQEHFSGDYNDLINAPNITEDESGNMVIADESGNIIFKADAEGIHTTAVSLNGEAAATEKYVDEAVANIDIPEVDFTGYATEDYVDNKVADLVNSAPEALNTLGELAAALENHEDAYDALLETVGGKATHTDLENLKEELSESITAEAEDWKVVDGNGNIIFSVDNAGAHTISLTLNGEEAATKTYVNEAISDIEFPEADFTGYATEKYVDEAIAAIPQTDLTGYATEKYVDDAVAAIDIPETDLSGYYTKEQTDTAINTAKEELSESIVTENEEWKVVDETGNIIFSVDATGAHTTALTLNGESVKDIIDGKVTAEISKKVDKVDGKGLSTNDFTNEYKEKLDGLDLENITFEETDPTVPAWAKEENKPTYTADEVGALSKDTPLFSGDYNDLENAPAISEDDSGDLIIADKDGNIIFRSNGDGFETVNLTVQNITINGVTIQEMIKTYVNSYLSK